MFIDWLFSPHLYLLLSSEWCVFLCLIFLYLWIYLFMYLFIHAILQIGFVLFKMQLINFYYNINNLWPLWSHIINWNDNIKTNFWKRACLLNSSLSGQNQMATLFKKTKISRFPSKNKQFFLKPESFFSYSVILVHKISRWPLSILADISENTGILNSTQTCNLTLWLLN
jgi:hypothetical protein